MIKMPPVSSSMFDEDPGIMSEVDTSATGFRRSIKARSSLPIVRTPSKTQDRSLGLVFLQYRNETKRALLPNEITSMDTVKALFVRSFPRQLTMDFLDSRLVRIYIHDPSKDMFYELEDLRDIRDRSVLRIYEQDVVNGAWIPVGSANGALPTHPQWIDDPSYFSEPEFDSEYQKQHIHRAQRKNGLPELSNASAQSQYYGTVIMAQQYRPQPPRNIVPAQRPVLPNQPPQPPERNKPYPGTFLIQPLVQYAHFNILGFSQTLPRGTHLMSTYSNILDTGGHVSNMNAAQHNNTQRPVSPDLIAKRPKENKIVNHNGQTALGVPSKPQRSFQNVVPQVHASRAPPTALITRVIRSPKPVSSSNNMVAYHNRPLPERPYSVAGHYPSPGSYQDYSGYLSSPERRVPSGDFVSPAGRSSFPPPGYPAHCDAACGSFEFRSGSTTPVIDEEARLRVQFMERQLVNLTGLVQKALIPPQSVPHSRDGPTGSEQREKPLGKPAPPPKPASLVGFRGSADGSSVIGGLHLNAEMYNQLRQLRKKTKDLRLEVRNLRRMAQSQATIARDTLKESCLKIKASLAFLSVTDPVERQMRFERLKLCREQDSYKMDLSCLEKDLSELESQVEELRSNVINRRCRVNMGDVESMALILSRASKTVADLKNRYPHLQDTLKTIMTQEMECIVREEK
ncbi:coiled-coil domain-containing protein-like isoform X1 [Leptotrombidium deliense]|uniref:Coiled-coil domain-containing protein-like isoform X1 n=1 Tax=Leptotrombidium deliense TaxID=299467 RepID=A0A443SLZ3_9ACAR|nr:coiled-coil domain-containing protein-like isoform X1 [Leptotrombidium deliense]